MTSVPSTSLGTLPPSSRESSLLSGSLGRRDYGSASRRDSREDSGGSLVPPVIEESEVEVEGGGYVSRSLESLGKRRARRAADSLQVRGEEMKVAAEEEWFEITNPERRKDHLTR